MSGALARLRSASGTLAGAAVLITVVTLASRAVGFGRWLAQASYVGSDGIGDLLNAANNLPNMLFEVAAGGALAGSVIPILSGPIARRREGEASRAASAFLGWTLVVLVPVAVALVLAARPIAGFLGSTDPVDVDVVARFLRVFAVQIPLYGIAVVLGAVLQAHKKFFWPAFTPLLSSLVVIGVYVRFGALAEGDQAHVAALSTAALDWLAWGMTVGVAALAIPLLWPTRRVGIRLRPTLRFPDGLGRRAMHLAFAGIGVLIAQQIALFVMLKAARSFGGGGTYTVYLYAQQVYFLPYAVLAFPLATSAFPRFAEHVAHGRVEEFRRLVSSTTRALLAIVCVGVAALVAAAIPVQVVFGTINKSGSTQGMGAALVAMAPGLIGYALILHLSRVLYTDGKQRSAVVAASLGWTVMAVCAYALPLLTGARGQVEVLLSLGAATTIGMTVAAIGLSWAVRRGVGAQALAGVGRTVGVLAVGTTVAGVAGYRLAGALLPEDAGIAVALGVGILAAVLAGAIVLVAVLVGDRETVSGLRRRVRRRAR